MQGNFNPNPMMGMNNMTPIHPMEDPEQQQDMMTEVLNIAKIKEGFYIGDKISAISIDVIIQFKITHMINATGNQIMNQWESIGISYLTLNWSETPKQILFDSQDEIANRIVEFIDGSLLGKGEGLFVARNLFYNTAKREGRRVGVLSEEFEEEPADNSHNPENTVLDGLQNRALYEALLRLDSVKREIVSLQYFSGMSGREIAAILGLREENVRVLSYRAKKELKHFMEEQGYGLS